METQQEPATTKRKMRGEKNPHWNKGPSLPEQRAYLSRFTTREDRAEYHRTFNVLTPQH